VEADRELFLEDASSLRDAMRRIVRYASDATEALDARIETEDLDGTTEAVELREVLERVQSLSLEPFSERLDLSEKSAIGCQRSALSFLCSC
jgi:hypothetical protein